MITAGYVFVSAFAALWIGFAFLRIRSAGAIVHILITGIVSALAYVLLKMGERAEIYLCLVPLILCISAVVLHLWLRCNWGAVAHVFMISQSALCVFLMPLSACRVRGLTAVGIGALMIGVFAVLTLRLRNRFLTSDWQEAFPPHTSDRSITTLRQQMYLFPLIMSVLLTAACLLLRVDSIPGCILLCLLGTAVFWLAVWLMVVINDYEKERTSLLAEQQYRGEMQSFLNVIRSQRHDFNFHVQTIAGLIRQGKSEECLQYINALEEDVAIMNTVLPVRDPAISAMIHNFRVLAVRQGTELHIDIHYDLSQIATNVYETNKIISNLLQNAIDEVSTHEDKSYGIWLTILKRGEYCVIRVSNKLKQPLQQEDMENIFRQGYTTKQGHEGVGLSSLRTLIGRYNGVIYTQVVDEEIQFIARVPISYAKEPITE